MVGTAAVVVAGHWRLIDGAPRRSISLMTVALLAAEFSAHPRFWELPPPQPGSCSGTAGNLGPAHPFHRLRRGKKWPGRFPRGRKPERTRDVECGVMKN